MNRHRAFTLLELLVVIAIIGILAALLFPVFGKAKNHAAKVTDIDNRKQIITAVHVYAGDNNDTVPPPNWDQGMGTITGWLYEPDENSPVFNVKTGLLWPMLSNTNLYFCPMDGPNVPGFLDRLQQISSYAMNGAVVGYYFHHYPPVKLSAMRPADCAFWETDERYPSFFNDGANWPGEGVSQRHQNGGIEAAFGGAVDYVQFPQWYADVACTNKNRLWCYPNTSDGGGPNGHDESP